MREVPMRDDRLEVSVTFDERRGYVGSGAELRSPVVALSLGGLRCSAGLDFACATAVGVR
jgi:hypothetical protein